MRGFKITLGTTLITAAMLFAGVAAAAADNFYGGPVYFDKPALAEVSAVVKAGGGAENFSFPDALVATLGKVAVQAEVNKLAKTYGQKDVDTTMTIMTYAVKDAMKRAKESGVALPDPADLTGEKLIGALVKLGVAPDGTFWAGYFFDHAITHDLHQQVMLDMNAQFGSKAVATTYRIINQAMFDMAQQLGMKDVKLASYH